MLSSLLPAVEKRIDCQILSGNRAVHNTKHPDVQRLHFPLSLCKLPVVPSHLLEPQHSHLETEANNLSNLKVQLAGAVRAVVAAPNDPAAKAQLARVVKSTKVQI